MQDFAAYFESLSDAQKETEVRALQTCVAEFPSSGLKSDEIESLFKYMHGLQSQGNIEEAAKIFHSLKPIIDAFRAEAEHEEAGLEYFYEWSTMALVLTPESMKSFVSLPLYQEMLEAFDNGPEKLRYRGVQVRCQLLSHFNFWLNKGGKEEDLEEEDHNFITDSIAEYDDLWELAYEFASANEDHDVLVKIFKNASQYHLIRNEPNDAIGCLKDALEHLPNTQNYQAADSADLLMQIGRLFMAFNKPQIAIRYFNEAIEIYHEGGEDLEMLAFQAEGWIEEAKKKLG